jgi:2-polyprenyl-6-methoxyphenol hydroxylase-like FAD-dependent oxidoreductase
MNKSVKKIVIVGGGSAGWLTAGIIAGDHLVDDKLGLEIILIESPDVLPIGVGEGTWPSMRGTLSNMGINENEFLLACDASFKQGSQFVGWQHGGSESYYHPFSLPAGYNQTNLAEHWQPFRKKINFAQAVSFQSHLCDQGLAPKQISTAQYACAANYGYHLDAGKFSQFLQNHCINKLGVKHITDHVTAVTSTENGDILSLSSKKQGEITGDLFIDCTGAASLLLGKHFNIALTSKKSILFNDSAVAVHVPYSDPNSPIASQTISTAQQAGWIWDIGLPSRRGVGHTYSSAHTSDESAERLLRQYIEPAIGKLAAEAAMVRKINITPGHREKFWHKNCVAIGMSAGFIEPLEASALALVELSAKMVSEQLPANRVAMDIVAKRFNDKFLHRWQQIIDFLKLHYILSKRDDSDYWLDNRDPGSIPESLQEQLSLWRYQVPYNYDVTHTEALFPPASFQYVLYGMGFITENGKAPKRNNQKAMAEQLFAENSQYAKKLLSVLPNNRELLEKVKKFGFPNI